MSSLFLTCSPESSFSGTFSVGIIHLNLCVRLYDPIDDTGEKENPLEFDLKFFFTKWVPLKLTIENKYIGMEVEQPVHFRNK